MRVGEDAMAIAMALASAVAAASTGSAGAWVAMVAVNVALEGC